MPAAEPHAAWRGRLRFRRPGPGPEDARLLWLRRASCGQRGEAEVNVAGLRGAGRSRDVSAGRGGARRERTEPRRPPTPGQRAARVPPAVLPVLRSRPAGRQAGGRRAREGECPRQEGGGAGALPAGRPEAAGWGSAGRGAGLVSLSVRPAGSALTQTPVRAHLAGGTPAAGVGDLPALPRSRRGREPGFPQPRLRSEQWAQDQRFGESLGGSTEQRPARGLGPGTWEAQ